MYTCLRTSIVLVLLGLGSAVRGAGQRGGRPPALPPRPAAPSPRPLAAPSIPARKPFAPAPQARPAPQVKPAPQPRPVPPLRHTPVPQVKPPAAQPKPPLGGPQLRPVPAPGSKPPVPTPQVRPGLLPSGHPRAAQLNQTLDSLRVGDSRQYQPVRGRDGRIVQTFCNRFVHDATKKLGAPIPLSVREPSGQVKWLKANDMHGWLSNSSNGWRGVSAAEAQRLANEGRPVVAAWQNPNPKGHGHIAMVRPGAYSTHDGPRITHAGAAPANDTTVARGFGRSRMGAVRYFYHPGR